MSTIMDVSFDFLQSLMGPLWVELSFAVFFAVGFILVRLEVFSGPANSSTKHIEILQAQLRKTIETEVAAGDMTAVVKAWRAAKKRMPTHWDTLKLVVKALLQVDPHSLVAEVVGHMADHREVLCNSRGAAIILDVVARAGNITLMEVLHRAFHEKFKIQPTAQIFEALLSGYACVGDEKQVARVWSRFREGPVKARARGFALTIKGFLRKGMIDATLHQMLDMHRAAFTVPSPAVTQLLRAACEAGRSMEIYSRLQKEMPVPPEGTVVQLEDCLKRADLAQARQVEQCAREQAGSLPLLTGAYEALLKNCILHNDLHALELFEEMQSSLFRSNDNLCVALLLKCADTKFLRFAEEIVKFLRRRDGMTLAVYSALMKVYAYAGMYDKACDLYSQIIAQGMKPDAMMCGCLMKFAVECGRTDLSRELFDKAPNLDIQNYMSLIRAAGHDKDIGRALEVFQKMKDSGVKPDIASYNCVLDVCVGAGDLTRARQLMAEMRTIGKLDIIAYNTFLKGFCFLSDIQGAKDLLSEMESMGMPPNAVSYNCLINAIVSKGMWQEAWDTIDIMERKGVPADSYTVSIMMKAVSRVKESRHVSRALALLDNSGLDVCSDEVLLTAVLETCTRHREFHRLQGVVDAYGRSNIKPTVHAFGYLIKACGFLKRVDKCWNLWCSMIEDCALEPNEIVLAIMIDALVYNDHLEEAVTMFNNRHPKISASTGMYISLLRAFANSRQASRAMAMWQQMQAAKIPMNTKVYNAVIDAQVRDGLMDEVKNLMQNMEQHGCTPDGITFSLIVKGYCFMGDLDKAFEVLRDMQKNHMAKDSVIYNTLLDGCVRHDRMDLADLILEDMENFNIVPSNFTLGILVKMYGRRKQLKKAFEAMSELQKRHGFKANDHVKTCLMSACFHNHDVEAAFKVFEELRTSEQGADWKTYSSMISGAVRHGYIEKAVAVVEDAYGLSPGAKVKALTPNKHLETESLELLLRAIVQRGHMQRVGVPLLNRLRAANIPINGRILTTFTAKANQW